MIASSIDAASKIVEITAASVENPDISDTLSITVRPSATGISITPNTAQLIDFTTGIGEVSCAPQLNRKVL